jgi:3-oxoacyl-[acyl-carrier protein] reductase
MSFEPIDRLDQRVAVITGGKGAIGLATARRLAARGARIVSLDRRDPAGVQALLDTLPAVESGRHLALTASILDSAQLAAAAQRHGHGGAAHAQLVNLQAQRQAGQAQAGGGGARVRSIPSSATS